MPAQIVLFVSRKDLLAKRGMKRFGRFMALTKGFVQPNSPQHLAWQEEEHQERKADAQWVDRHGLPIDGAQILAFRSSSRCLVTYK